MGMATGVNKPQGSGVRRVQVQISSLGTHRSHSSPQQSRGHSYSHIWCHWLYRYPRAGKGCSRRDPRGLQDGQGTCLRTSQATRSAFLESRPQAPKALWLNPSLWSPLYNFPIGSHHLPLMCPCNKLTPSRNCPQSILGYPACDKVLSLTELEWASQSFS